MSFDQLVTLCWDTDQQISETPSRISKHPSVFIIKETNAFL